MCGERRVMLDREADVWFYTTAMEDGTLSDKSTVSKLGAPM